jgi:hypothetical protein
MEPLQLKMGNGLKVASYWYQQRNLSISLQKLRVQHYGYPTSAYPHDVQLWTVWADVFFTQLPYLYYFLLFSQN